MSRTESEDLAVKKNKEREKHHELSRIQFIFMVTL